MEVIGAVEPLNQFLRDLHGPSDNISRTIGRLVPFPETLRSLDDAELLDVSVSADAACPPDALVSVSGRYATSARLAQARTFYEDQFRSAGIAAASVEPSLAGTRVTLLAAQGSGPQYSVTIDEHRGYRSVRIATDYRVLEYRALFDRFTQWHNGQAPITELCSPTGFEISTFASGRLPSTLALYTTHYACTQTPLALRRHMVDERLNELGWTYSEPRDGILFLRGCEFPAEIHVTGDHQSSTVSFVGEFQLREHPGC